MIAGRALALSLLTLAGCTDGTEDLPPAVRLVLEPAEATAGVGERVDLAAVAVHRDGSIEEVTRAARWDLSGPGTLDGPGRMHGGAPGAVALEARWSGLRAQARLVVESPAPEVRSLSILPAEAHRVAGGAVALAARATFADGSARDVSAQASWTVSAPAVARLAGTAPVMVEARAPGTTTVEARLGGRAASGRLVVEAPARHAPAFPLHLSADRRILEDAANRPFRIHGDAAWSLVANLTPEEAERYLADRAARGFDAILVNLIEHRFAAAAPRDREGRAPFDPPGDFGHPYEPYFASARQRVERAGRHGLLVLLIPAYLGYGCPTAPSPANEGWSAELSRVDPAVCASYGRYVGERFRGLDNVLWVEGGDCTPPPGSALERCAGEMMRALRQADPAALQTGHFRPNGDSLDEPALARGMDVNSVYQYRVPYLDCRRAYARTPPLPAYLAESGYEHEQVQGSSAPVRKLILWASLTCTAGAVFGSRPVWLFGPGWQEGLDSPATRDVQRVGALLERLPWERLVPSGLGGMRQLVTAGLGLPRSEERVAAAATPEGDLLLAYVPPGRGRPRSIVVDTRGLAGPATARWFRPGTGDWIPVGQVRSGRTWFTTPGGTPGDDDWLLVVEAS